MTMNAVCVCTCVRVICFFFFIMFFVIVNAVKWKRLSHTHTPLKVYCVLICFAWLFADSHRTCVVIEFIFRCYFSSIYLINFFSIPRTVWCKISIEREKKHTQPKMKNNNQNDNNNNNNNKFILALCFFLIRSIYLVQRERERQRGQKQNVRVIE